jgi:hypothetical protein
MIDMKRRPLEPISLTFRAKRPVMAGSIGLRLISLVLNGAAQVETDQLAETNSAGAFASSEHISKNWTSFRGPSANGHAAHANPPLDWSAEET